MAVLKTLAVRRDWKAMLQTLDRYEREGKLSRAQVAGQQGLDAHDVRKAEGSADSAGDRETRGAQGGRNGRLISARCTLMWLKMRLGRPVVLSQEDVARAARPVGPSLVGGLRGGSRQSGTFSDPRCEIPGDGTRLSKPFVREELQFARGCLAFVRRDLKTARRLIEPLAENTEVSHRFHVLARLYEAQGMWPEAAARYEAVVNNPNFIALGWPALWNLDRFRLAQVYERLGDSSRARQLYERFAADWKDGDRDIPELATARQRLAVLSKP